jgi:hypothetical protein
VNDAGWVEQFLDGVLADEEHPRFWYLRESPYRYSEA